MFPIGKLSSIGATYYVMVSNRVLKWSATAVTIAGAILTSMNLFPWNVLAFNIGSVLWLAFAFRIKERSLIVVNAALLLIYMVGLFI